MTQQKAPITQKLDQTPEEQLRSLEALVSSQTNNDSSQEENSPLRVIPILTDDGVFQGYFVPASQEAPFPTTQTAVESTLQDVTPAQVSRSPVVTRPITLPIFLLRKPDTATTATMLTVGLSCLLALSLFFALVHNASLQKTIVSITPLERQYSATIPLHLVTGSPTSLSQVEARRLPYYPLTGSFAPGDGQLPTAAHVLSWVC